MCVPNATSYWLFGPRCVISLPLGSIVWVLPPRLCWLSLCWRLLGVEDTLVLAPIKHIRFDSVLGIPFPRLMQVGWRLECEWCHDNVVICQRCDRGIARRTAPRRPDASRNVGRDTVTKGAERVVLTIEIATGSSGSGVA